MSVIFLIAKAIAVALLSCFALFLTFALSFALLGLIDWFIDR